LPGAICEEAARDPNSEPVIAVAAAAIKDLLLSLLSMEFHGVGIDIVLGFPKLSAIAKSDPAGDNCRIQA
jgi:hypothetical protein